MFNPTANHTNSPSTGRAAKTLGATLLAVLSFGIAACGPGLGSDLSGDASVPVAVSIDPGAAADEGAAHEGAAEEGAAPSVAPAISVDRTGQTGDAVNSKPVTPSGDDEAAATPADVDHENDTEGKDDADGTDEEPTAPQRPAVTVHDFSIGPVDPGSVQITDFGNPTVPGEPIEYGPELGRPLTIVGVQYDDVLNFRLAPSPNATIVDSIPALAPEIDMFSLGEAWAAPSGVWYKVNVMGQEAWANQKYLAVRGGSMPIFDEVASELGILMFEDLEDAALEVAATRASIEPESRIVLAQAPYMWDTHSATIVVDVLDMGDHLLKGERLFISVEVVFDEESGEPGAQDIAFVVLNGVEMQAMWSV